MPVLLHKDAWKDWLNPRYSGEELLRSAVTEVSYMPVDGARQMHLGI